MKATAAGLAALGRGPDSMLVHMSPREVQGLQSLAMAHGGSLTINPQTGLPEAGILSSILPMVAGAALAATGVGAPMAALMVGGVGALATGSLGKGLMMGLGAYGGAGLGQSLSAAGAVGDTVVAQGADIVPSVAQGGGSDAAAMALRTPPNAWTASQQAIDAAMPITEVPGANAWTASQQAIDAAMPITEVPGANAWTASQQAIDAAMPAGNPTLKMPTSFGGMGQGISNLMSSNDATQKAALEAAGGWKNLAMKGGMAAAPMLMAGLQSKPLQTPPKTPTTYAKYGYNQVRNPLWGQPGQPYFTQGYSSPTFTTDPREVMGAKAGGLMALARGGMPYDESNDPLSQTTIKPAMDRTDVPGAGYQKTLEDEFASKSSPYLSAVAKSDNPILAATARKILSLREISQRASPPTFMAADGGQVPAPQMPISPLFQQAQTAPAGDLNNYLAQLGQRVMGGVTPPTQLPGMGAINPLAITPDVSANGNTFSLPAQTTSDITKQYMYNPATQTFGINPNYVAPVEPVVESNDGGDDYDGGDAAGGPIKARYAAGGLSALSEYAAGGRLLNGPGDGVSDSIPAVIKGPRPQRAALADGEFVIPARIVSELGNGSTKAGAKRLYAMMERVQQARRKTTGKNKVAVDNKPDKLLPA